MKVYPVFLNDLDKRRCIVVGGGGEAQRKVEGLLDCEAVVSVIAKQVTDQLQAWAGEGRITWVEREYQTGDLKGAFLVISENADPESNLHIWEDAEAEGALVNVMDDIPHCNFIAGSVVSQGALVVSISTSGVAPALAVRLRERMQRDLGPEYAEFLALMGELRDPMAARYPDFDERRSHWYELVDSDIIDLLREGQPNMARQRVTEIVGKNILAP